MPDTVECLESSQWSHLLEFCNRSCSSPRRLSFAKISEEYETKNFYAVGITVSYVCRPGYEKVSERLLNSTCLENLTWSEVPELCPKKSCGIPANPKHGKVAKTDHLFGAKANVICDDGYRLVAQSPFIHCVLRGNDVAWSKLPACQAIACAPPPAIRNGKHNGSSMDEFRYNSVVTYTCDPGLRLTGNESLRCVTENKIHGVWSGPPPECKAFFSVVDTMKVTTATKLLEDERAENHHILAFILIPSCIGVCILLVWVIMRWKKKKKKHSYDTYSPEHEIKRTDLQESETEPDNEKRSVPWHHFFCHRTSCHVCPSCEAGLHAHLGRPAGRLCTACGDWQRARHGPAPTYSALSISGAQSQNLADRSSTDKAPDLLKRDFAEEEILERHEAEQPGNRERPAHICPLCEDWLRTHLGQRESAPAAPAEPAAPPSRQGAGAGGALCPACEDQLYLSLVPGAEQGCYACPLRGAGAGAHLVPACAPACHACPRCRAPTHAHLCQRRDGRTAAPQDADPRWVWFWGQGATNEGEQPSLHGGSRGVSCQRKSGRSRRQEQGPGTRLRGEGQRQVSSPAPAPHALPGDCGPPPRFSFAEPPASVNTSYPFGSSLRYRCRPGYTGASGKSPFVTCHSNSSWLSENNFCIGKPCGPLDISNGRFDYTTDLRFGAVVNVTCNEGYRIIGESSLQCILQGNDVAWSDAPHCEIIPCMPPPEIANGQLSGDSEDFTFGSTVTYSCHPGFSLIGESTIHCTSVDKLNGKWSGPAPECKMVRCQNPEVKSGEKVSGFGTEYTYKETVTFQCKPGHVLIGSSTVTCEADSMWKPSLPTCEARYCGTPPSFAFAELTSAVSDQSLAETKLTYKCKPGYTAASGKSSIVTCLINTTWSSDPDFCIRKQCSSPQINNGKVIADNFQFETTVSFTCNAGYKLKGSSSSTCVISGNGVGWDTAFPSCERQLPDVFCGPPPTIDNGIHNETTKSSFLHGSVVVYECNKGFILTGEASIRCVLEDESHGVWSKPTPECKGQLPDVFCGPPPTIDNGIHNETTKSSFLHGSVVVYECNKGFILTGEASIRCVSEDESHGVWSKPTPECKGTANKIIAGILPLFLAILIIHF
ncbi:C4b-binding protein alpha chain [Rhea pennata]|uniref:C4b-binding protein alpha chain n=1 Tax=Rhea pennata TaxID=8795 RepID=UPI002E2594DC